MSAPAVFLDRDGTIVREVGYLASADRMEILPWSAEAIRLLSQGGFRVVVITNQAGVARGYFTEEAVIDLHRELAARLAREAARIDAFYYCPHHPAGSVERYATACDCRKPGTALVERAATDLGIDLARSFVVGDRWHDVALAQKLGATGILVRTGYGREEEAQPAPGVTAGAIVDDLLAAARWILQHASAESLC